MTDDNEDLAVEVRPVRKSKGKKGPEDEQAAVIENDEPIPLFPHLDKDARFVVTMIRVNKRSPPGEGYKGDIAPSSTLDFIAKRFGNGIYDLEALNQHHQVLRRTQNIKIDVSMDVTGAGPTKPYADAGPMAERLLDRQAAQFEADSKRSKELSDKTLDITKSLSSEYSALIREDAKLRLERDRAYFDAQNKQVVGMMQGLLAQTQQMHEQSMSAAREGFQQTMQMMQLQHQHSQAMNNPVLLLSLFKEGLNMGQGMNESDDALTTVLKSGVMGLGHIKEMMGLNATAKPPTLAGANHARLPNPAGKTGGKKSAPLTNDELRDLIRLKKLAQAQGQDFHGMVLQAQKVLGAQSETETDESEESDDESGDDHPDDKGEDRDSDVERGKSTDRH